MKKLKEYDANVQNGFLALEKHIQTERAKGKDIDARAPPMADLTKEVEKSIISVRQFADCCHYQNSRADKKVQQLRMDTSKELKHCDEARRLVQGDAILTDYFLQFSETLYGKLHTAWRDISQLEMDLLASAEAHHHQTSQPQLVMEALQQQHDKFEALCQQVALVHTQADQLREQYLRTFEIRAADAQDPFRTLEDASQQTATAAAAKLIWMPGQGGFQGSTFSGPSGTSLGAFGATGQSASSSSSAFGSVASAAAPSLFGSGGGFGFGGSSSAGGFGAFGGSSTGAGGFGFAPSSAPVSGFGMMGQSSSQASSFGGGGGAFGFQNPTSMAAPFGGAAASPFSMPSTPSPFDVNRPKPKAAKKKNTR